MRKASMKKAGMRKAESPSLALLVASFFFNPIEER
jgi:hypothetical protein